MSGQIETAKYVLHHRVAEFEAIGWRRTNAFLGIHHGEHAVLMTTNSTQIATDILARASSLVSGDRQASHGDMLVNHECIAALWNGYLAARKTAGRPQELDAEDVATLMECLKIARRLSGAFNIEDYVDAAGYAAVAGECRARGS